MIPYTRHTIHPDDEAAVLRALRSGYLTQGPEVEAFESELAALTCARYAVAVNSGTAALHLAYLASEATHLNLPCISFVATANVALVAGITVGWHHGSPGKGWHELNAVGVTLGGDPLNWTPLILDACHGPLTHDADLATVFSFHPAKHAAAGEGGAVVTDDADVAERCRLLRSHGRRGTEMVALGFNYRMPEACAALARSQLTRYHAGVAERRRLAAVYDAAFAGHPVIQPVPHNPDSARHLYQVLVEQEAPRSDQRLPYTDCRYTADAFRDMVKDALAQRGIATAVHYPVIPLQPYYRERYGYRPGQFPGAEAHAARTLSLPLYPGLAESEQRHVITSLLEVAG